MEKRFVGFLVAAFLILTLNVFFSNWLNPQPEKPAVAEAKKPPVAAPVQPAGDDAAPVAEVAPVEASDDPADAAATPPVRAEQQWIALGSLDPQDPYRMLVTLTNHGAAIRRLELSSDRYYDLQERSGYLGELQAITAPDKNGVLVQVVGAGTPAAKAGLKPGDQIVTLADKPVLTPDELRQALRVTKPGQKVKLGVERAGRTLALEAVLRWTPLDVMRPERENVFERQQLLDQPEVLPPGFVDPPSYLLTLAQIDKAKLAADEAAELAGVKLIDANWEIVDQSPDQVTFRQTVPAQNLEVIKRFRVAKVPVDKLDSADYPAYHLDFDIELRNVGTAAQEIAYRLDGPTGLPTEGWWYASKISRNWGGAGMRDFVVQYHHESPVMFSPSSIAEGVKLVEAPLMYAAVDGQYFASALVPHKKELEQVWFQETRGLLLGPKPDDTTDQRLLNVSFRLTSKPVTLEAGKELKHSFTLFAGPKKPSLLAHYGQGEENEYGLSSLVYYGYPIWSGVAQVMLNILHFFHAIVGNYGLAIILLTVLVRGLMFPLSRKQALNMVKMQQLQPEMKRIQEKYKKEMEKRTQAQQELFRKNNYNPMGGCLLMFLQLPIFLGLYRALSVDVELRQAPLLGEAIRWGSNLAAPDMLFDWSAFMPAFITSGVGFFGLGPYFNILPLVTVALFIFQQKMFMPPPADEQAALQQKMMQYMMIFIGLMFYKVAAGLCLYFIASTLWGMAERKFLPKAQTMLAGVEAGGGSSASADKSANGQPRGGRPKARRKK